MSFPDFPSWHYPGSTALVLFEALSGPAAQLEPPPASSAPIAGRGASTHPLRRLLVLGLNEALARGVITLDGKVQTTGGHFMAELGGRPSVVSWSDAGFEEVRISVWWGYDHSKHPQANHEGSYRENFHTPEPLAKRSHYPKFVGVTVSAWLSDALEDMRPALERAAADPVALARVEAEWPTVLVRLQALGLCAGATASTASTLAIGRAIAS